MRIRMRLKLHLVVGHDFLPAKGAERHGLLGLDGQAVGFDGCSRAGRVGLFVLALDAVFLGDGHVCVL